MRTDAVRHSLLAKSYIAGVWIIGLSRCALAKTEQRTTNSVMQPA